MRYRRAHFGGSTVDSIADDRSGEGILRVSCFFELISFGALKGIFFDVWAGFFAKQRVAAAAARTWLGTNKQAFRCNHLFIRHFHSFPRSKAKAKKKKKSQAAKPVALRFVSEDTFRAHLVSALLVFIKFVLFTLAL